MEALANMQLMDRAYACPQPSIVSQPGTGAGAAAQVAHCDRFSDESSLLLLNYSSVLWSNYKAP